MFTNASKALGIKTFVIGAMASLLNSDTRKILTGILGDESEEKGLQKLADEITTDYLQEFDRTEFVMTMLREFNRGLQEKSRSE